VHEWVNDYYDEKYYQTSPSQDPAGPTSGSGLGRTLRGGSWLNSPNEVRVSQRRGSDPGLRFETSGFRCGGEVFAPSSTPPAQEMESPQRGIGARIRN
jgi:formylglycine-generating enzyme required for sulfatase activity